MSDVMKTEMPDLDTMDLDALSEAGALSLEDIEEQERSAKQGASRGPENVWFPGYGVSFIRLVQYWNAMKEVRTKEGISLGGWDAVFTWHLHDRFLPNSVVVCLRDTYGEDCPICDLRFELGKLFDDFKHEFVKKAGVYVKTRGYANIELIEDCGDKGSQKWPRQVYEPGKVYQAQVPITGLNAIFEVMKNEDWNEEAPIQSPVKGRVLRYEVKDDPASGFRKHLITPRAGDKWAGPLWPLPDPKKGYKGAKPNGKAIKAVLKRAKDLSAMMKRPTEQDMVKVEARCEELRQMAKAAKGGTSYSPSTPSGGTNAMGDRTEAAVKKSTAVAGPTEITDGSGTRLCFGKHYSDTEILCDICDTQADCKAAMTSEKDDINF